MLSIQSFLPDLLEKIAVKGCWRIVNWIPVVVPEHDMMEWRCSWYTFTADKKHTWFLSTFFLSLYNGKSNSKKYLILKFPSFGKFEQVYVIMD